MDYYSYQNLISDALLLQKQYSGLIEYETIGYSVKRRKIIMLIMGCGYRTIFLTGGIHGRESINTKLLMMLVSYYAEKYYGKDIFNRYSFNIIPLVNPDGYVMATSDDSKKEYKYNYNNVDINRNFPSVFYQKGGASGPYAASEPETNALMMAFKSHPSVMYLDFHSRGECIYYYRQAMSSKYNERQRAIANELKESIGYNLVPPEDEIGVDDSGGNSVHFYSEKFKMPAFTIETAPEDTAFPMDIRLAEEAFDRMKDILLDIVSICDSEVL